jgi:hypothetical protein
MALRALVVMAVVAVVFGSSALSEPAQARGRSDTVRAGARLHAGDSRTSRNGRYRLLMRRDGNLVLYRSRRGKHRHSRAVWSTQTGGHRGAYGVMQADGDFVVYSRARDALYATGTKAPNGHAIRPRLMVRGNGSVVVLQDWSKQAWTSASGDKLLTTGQVLHPGQSRRSANGQYQLLMQGGGNLVLSDAARNVLWSSQTGGNPGAWTAMQPDGNLVVYSADRRPLYSTATKAGEGSHLLVQDDGNAVLYSGSNEPQWASATDVQELGAGQTLHPGQSRRSANSQYLLTMRTDGDLVLADRPGHVLWNSQTGGNPGARAEMQFDGNLVVYTTGGEPIFATGARGDARSHLRVQDDGNAVVYDGANKPTWASASDVFTLVAGQSLRAGQSRRSPNGRYILAMQSDGDLVFYDHSTGKALWNSGTAGNPGASASMQGDGNLVVYSAARQPIYATGSHGDKGSWLNVQDDGNLVIYNGANQPIWASRR